MIERNKKRFDFIDSYFESMLSFQQGPLPDTKVEPDIKDLIPLEVQEVQEEVKSLLTRDERNVLAFFAKYGVYSPDVALVPTDEHFYFDFEPLQKYIDQLVVQGVSVHKIVVPNFDLEYVSKHQWANLSWMIGDQIVRVTGTGESVVRGVAEYPQGDMSVIVEFHTIRGPLTLRVWKNKCEWVEASGPGWFIGDTLMSTRIITCDFNYVVLSYVDYLEPKESMIINIDGINVKMVTHATVQLLAKETLDGKWLTARKGDKISRNETIIPGRMYTYNLITEKLSESKLGYIDSIEWITLVRNSPKIDKYPHMEVKGAEIKIIEYEPSTGGLQGLRLRRNKNEVSDGQMSQRKGWHSRRAAFSLYLSQHGYRGSIQGFEDYCAENSYYFRKERPYRITTGINTVYEIRYLGGASVSKCPVSGKLKPIQFAHIKKDEILLKLIVYEQQVEETERLLRECLGVVRTEKRRWKPHCWCKEGEERCSVYVCITLMVVMDEKQITTWIQSYYKWLYLKSYYIRIV